MRVFEDAEGDRVALAEERWVWALPCAAEVKARKVTLSTRASGERIGIILSDEFQAW
jgi:hypothetical protein